MRGKNGEGPAFRGRPLLWVNMGCSGVIWIFSHIVAHSFSRVHIFRATPWLRDIFLVTNKKA